MRGAAATVRASSEPSLPSPRALAGLLAVASPLALAALPAAADTPLGTRVGFDAEGRAVLQTVIMEATPGSLQRVSVKVSSDGGRELKPTTETDAWQHGVAALAADPGAEAKVELILYNARGVELVSFTGAVDADGVVTAAADPGEFTCTRRGCGYATPSDVELIVGAVLSDSSGARLTVDLQGSAVPQVAAAELRVTPCDLSAERGICLFDGMKTQVADLTWEGVGSVWSTTLDMSHEGGLDVQVRPYGLGGPLRGSRAALAVPWDDGGSGVSPLAAEGDPLTTLGLMDYDGATLLGVWSEGWTVETAPAAAELSLEDGTVLSIPADSYQRRAPELLYAPWDDTIKEYYLAIDGRSVSIRGGSISVTELSNPTCFESTCVVLRKRGDSAALVVSQHRWDTAFVSGETNVVLKAVGADGGTTTLVDERFVFEEEVMVTFANEVSFDGDPIRRGFAGQLTLVDDGGGTLATGGFYGLVDRTEDGGYGLAGVGASDIAAMAETNFAVLLTGRSTSCGDDESGYLAPPPLAAVAGNGSGTKAAITTTSAKPFLL